MASPYSTESISAKHEGPTTRVIASVDDDCKLVRRDHLLQALHQLAAAVPPVKTTIIYAPSRIRQIRYSLQSFAAAATRNYARHKLRIHRQRLYQLLSCRFGAAL